MKRMIRATLAGMLMFASLAHAGNLVLSQDLEIHYPTPVLISHTSTVLLVKFDDWVLSHQVVDPTSIYPQVDLSGIEDTYIQSIFKPEVRNTLPKWLRVLSEEQAVEFGLPDGGVTQRKVGEFEILGTYSEKHGSGYLYIFDRAAVHYLTVQGTQDHYRDIVDSIKER